MAGLLLIGILVAWLVAAGTIAAWITSRVRSAAWRFVLAPVVFVSLLALPFIDEIIGKYQLRALCEEGAIPRYDEVRVRGKSVNLRRIPHPHVPKVLDVPTRTVRAWIPILEQDISWVDSQSGDVLISYKAYEAKGGWLIRALGISQTNAPLTFEPAWCRPNEVALFRELKVTSD
jgi:hypothetical protein